MDKMNHNKSGLLFILVALLSAINTISVIVYSSVMRYSALPAESFPLKGVMGSILVLLFVEAFTAVIQICILKGNTSRFIYLLVNLLCVPVIFILLISEGVQLFMQQNLSNSLNVLASICVSFAYLVTRLTLTTLGYSLIFCKAQKNG